jgi:hypothetical protein
MLTGENAPPYLTVNLEPVLEADGGNINYAGIRFNIANTSQKTISSFVTSCFLYDGNTRKPLMQNNRVRSGFTGAIIPKDERVFTISLDDRIGAVPDSPFIIDFFTLTRVDYSDGSSWTDPYCIWYTRYEK